MKIVEKLKKGLLHVISEHAVSIGLYGLLTIISVVFCGPYNENHEILFAFLKYTHAILFSSSISALLCESIHLYHKDNNTKKIITFVIIMLTGIVTSVLNISAGGVNPSVITYRITCLTSKGFISGLYLSVVILYLCFIIFFCYKKSKESFEMYVAKAFCGVMKTELLYVILMIGSFLIIAIIDSLLFDMWDSYVTERVELFLLGFVAYPCAIVGISDTDYEISKFGKAILSYVFVSLLSIAYVIIYIYIFKIIITWTFPSNEVFRILTALFVFGIGIWTMAYGCTKGIIRKFVEFLPFLFIPFIVLQVMCLHLRISEYGFTTSRYLGMMLIIFELIYMVLYAIRFFGKKDVAANSLFIVSALTIVTLIVPVINASSVVTASQKSKIEKYLSYLDEADDACIEDAMDAYDVINYEGGETGRKYLDNRLSQDQKDFLSEGYYHYERSEKIYINLTCYLVSEIDTSDVDNVFIIDKGISDDNGIDTSNVCIYASGSGELLATLDLKDMVDTLIEKDSEDVSPKEMIEITGKELITNEGYRLVLTSFTIWGERGEENKVTHMAIEGYLLK